MKSVIAVLSANLKETPLGTRSRLAEELNGRPILRATVERLRRACRIIQVFVLAPADQAEAVRALLSGLEVTVLPHDAGPSPWHRLVQSSRKWSLDGWRGGVGGTTVFDEFTDVRLLQGVLESVSAEAVLSVPPCAPLFDADLADRMIAHMEKDEEDSRLTFTQAPPGIAGLLLRADLVKELAESRTPLGWLFSYKPDSPRRDLIFESCCFPCPIELRHSLGRLMADTDRSIETLRALLTDHPEADLPTVGSWLTKRAERYVPPVPREVEIELTTDDPYPQTLLRPRGNRIGRTGTIHPAVVEHVANELRSYDDSLIVLGGFGDPLRHPQLASVLEILRPSRERGTRVFGLAVRTFGVDLTPRIIDALITHRVDVLNVLLDAWTPELYGRLQSPETPDEADLSAVLAGLERLEAARTQRGSAHPILLPEFTKARDNLHELDAFHDGWLRKQGTVVIRGFDRHGGLLEDRSVINMSPPARFACRRIQSRCLVLADGRVTLCDQDAQGRHALGRLPGAAEWNGKDRMPRGAEPTGNLSELWQGAEMIRVRKEHQSGRFDATDLCAVCEEWHRP